MIVSPQDGKNTSGHSENLWSKELIFPINTRDTHPREGGSSFLSKLSAQNVIGVVEKSKKYVLALLICFSYLFRAVFGFEPAKETCNLNLYMFVASRVRV